MGYLNNEMSTYFEFLLSFSHLFTEIRMAYNFLQQTSLRVIQLLQIQTLWSIDLGFFLQKYSFELIFTKFSHL